MHTNNYHIILFMLLYDKQKERKSLAVLHQAELNLDQYCFTLGPCRRSNFSFNISILNKLAGKTY